MKKYCIGVDIGGTTVKLGIFTYNGELCKKWEIATRTEEKGKHILKDIALSIDTVLLEENIDKSEVSGIGVGVPGPVTNDGIVSVCVNLGWKDFEIEKELEKESGLKVKAANDANIAALGEAWQGGGKGFKNMVMVTLGTGVGGGVIIDGKIISGSNGAGGEIGHIKMKNDEVEKCGCGKTGCLEQYASATGVVRLANRKLKSTDLDSKLRSIESITAKDVFDMAKEGDKLSLEIVDEFAEILGIALSHISCVCDPDVFVIGGGVSKAGDIITSNVLKYYKENAFLPSKGTDIKLALLGNDAGIYGGAKLSQQI